MYWIHTFTFFHKISKSTGYGQSGVVLDDWQMYFLWHILVYPSWTCPTRVHITLVPFICTKHKSLCYRTMLKCSRQLRSTVTRTRETHLLLEGKYHVPPRWHYPLNLPLIEVDKPVQVKFIKDEWNVLTHVVFLIESWIISTVMSMTWHT